MMLTPLPLSAIFQYFCQTFPMKKLSIIICLTIAVLLGNSIDNKSISREFHLDKRVIGVSGLKTVCSTHASRTQDTCLTHFAYAWDLATGGKFGELTIIISSGTDEYSSPSGECGLKFNQTTARGRKGYKDNTKYGFTGCYIGGGGAKRVLTALLGETRFEFYEPRFKGKNRNQFFYSSDIEGLTATRLMGAALHHSHVSAKRTKYTDTLFFHNILFDASSWTYAKVLAKFKYYQIFGK